MLFFIDDKLKMVIVWASAVTQKTLRSVPRVSVHWPWAALRAGLSDGAHACGSCFISVGRRWSPPSSEAEAKRLSGLQGATVGTWEGRVDPQASAPPRPRLSLLICWVLCQRWSDRHECALGTGFRTSLSHNVCWAQALCQVTAGTTADVVRYLIEPSHSPRECHS